MMAPDPDDFDWGTLEAQLGIEEPDNITDVTKFTDIDLINYERTLVEQLKQRGEMINVTTETGREIHSLRAAARIELFRRGLKG